MKKKRLSSALKITIIILLALIIYCLYHSFLAEKSFKNIGNLQNKIILKKQELAAIEELVGELGNKILLIEDDNGPDLDLLDELVRMKLGKLPADEFVIYKGLSSS